MLKRSKAYQSSFGRDEIKKDEILNEEEEDDECTIFKN
jgi:hypothetical protein